MQNGYIERFNRIYRESILDAYLFFELDQVRTLTEEWMDEWKMKQLKLELSTFKLQEKRGTYKVTKLFLEFEIK